MCRKWFRIVNLVLSCVLLVSAVGCDRKPMVGDDFKSRIRRYDQYIGELFSTYDLKPLRDSLTESHFNRLDHRLTGFKNANRRMKSTVQQIEFLEFKDDGTGKTGFPRALVKTRETWDVRHIDGRTGQVVKEVKGLVYDLLYEFELHDGMWQIDAVNVLKEIPPK